MFELGKDLIIKCKNCGKIHYISKEFYAPDERWTGDGEKAECYISIKDELICDNCQNTIFINISAIWYYYDLHDLEPAINGGYFEEHPYFIESYDENNYEDFYHVYHNADRIRQLILRAAMEYDFINKIDPFDFEAVVEQLFIDKGFETKLTKRTHDGGKDIILKKDIGTLSPIVLYVQCKRYSPNRAVGLEPIQAFNTIVREQGVNRGYYITTSYFSSGAKKFAIEHGSLYELVDGEKLHEMIRNNARDYYLAAMRI